MSQAQQGLDALAAVIRTQYDLGAVSPPRVLPGAHQRRHRKLLVTTDAGEYLVKTYKRDPYVLDALRFQHRLASHLAQNDLPVARIQRARDGRKIVEVDDWAMELQEFVPGEPMRVMVDTLGVSAQALGRFHTVCREFPRPERDARIWRFSEVPRSAFQHLFDRAKATGDANQVTEWCNLIALFLRDATRALSWEARDQFETGLIHGDWHGGNLIFQENKLVAIVDLEFAGDGCFLEDLAYGVSNLCIRTSVDPERLRARTDMLLTYYQRHRSLSLYEVVALYYAVGIKHIATVSYQVQQMETVAGYRADQWMERLARQCEWLAAQAHKIRYG